MDAHLVVIKGNPRGQTLTFGPGEYLFGRGAECHVRPDSDWVSRQHCQLQITLDQVILRDLGSTNGTLVNGQRILGERVLVHNDVLQVGPLVLQLRLPAEEPLLESLKETALPVSDLTVFVDSQKITAEAIVGLEAANDDPPRDS